MEVVCFVARSRIVRKTCRPKGLGKEILRRRKFRRGNVSVNGTYINQYREAATHCHIDILKHM
jgi:hypothetical protein